MNHWTQEAICPPLPGDRPLSEWTTDTRPDDDMMQMLQGICSHCPVEARCALEALNSRAEGGVYAGIHVPVRSDKSRDQWQLARVKLKAKASKEYPDASTALRKPGSKPGGRSPGSGRQADFIKYPCGTEAAWRRHWRRGEKPCEACREASNRIDRERHAKSREAKRLKVVS